MTDEKELSSIAKDLWEYYMVEGVRLNKELNRIKQENKECRETNKRATKRITELIDQVNRKNDYGNILIENHNHERVQANILILKLQNKVMKLEEKLKEAVSKE